VARSARLTVVADTGPIYALIDASDNWHARVNAWWERAVSDVVLPVTILAEVTHLLQTRIGPIAEEAFVRAIADGEFAIEQIEDDDLPRIADLMHAYRDVPLGFVTGGCHRGASRAESRRSQAFWVAEVRVLSLLP
jgi:predicted nucleic acid-binding protein